MHARDADDAADAMPRRLLLMLCWCLLQDAHADYAHDAAAFAICCRYASYTRCWSLFWSVPNNVAAWCCAAFPAVSIIDIFIIAYFFRCPLIRRRAFRCRYVHDADMLIFSCFFFFFDVIFDAFIFIYFSPDELYSLSFAIISFSIILRSIIIFIFIIDPMTFADCFISLFSSFRLMFFDFHISWRERGEERERESHQERRRRRVRKRKRIFFIFLLFSLSFDLYYFDYFSFHFLRYFFSFFFFIFDFDVFHYLRLFRLLRCFIILIFSPLSWSSIFARLFHFPFVLFAFDDVHYVFCCWWWCFSMILIFWSDMLIWCHIACRLFWFAMMLITMMPAMMRADACAIILMLIAMPALSHHFSMFMSFFLSILWRYLWWCHVYLLMMFWCLIFLIIDAFWCWSAAYLILMLARCLMMIDYFYVRLFFTHALFHFSSMSLHFLLMFSLDKHYFTIFWLLLCRHFSRDTFIISLFRLLSFSIIFTPLLLFCPCFFVILFSLFYYFRLSLSRLRRYPIIID